MKCNFDFLFKGLDGIEIEGGHAGRTLSSAMVGQTKGDVVKMFDLGLRIYNRETVDLDRADQEMLKSFIKGSETLTILAKQQLLEVLNAKESKDEPATA